MIRYAISYSERGFITEDVERLVFCKPLSKENRGKAAFLGISAFLERKVSQGQAFPFTKALDYHLVKAFSPGMIFSWRRRR